MTVLVHDTGESYETDSIEEAKELAEKLYEEGFELIEIVGAGYLYAE